MRANPLKLFEAAESDAEVRYILDHEPYCFWAYILDLQLEPFQREFILACERYHNILGEWPAQFGKSTNVSYGYVVWHSVRNPNVRIISVMKTTEEADDYGMNIRLTLEDNRRLVDWYGTQRHELPAKRKSQPWSQNGINVAQRQIFDPHYTVEWFGSNSDAVLGHRCDIIVIDDVVTPDTAGTPDRRQKQLRRMEMQYQTAPIYKFPVLAEKVTDYPVDDSRTGRFRGYLQVPEGIFWPKDISYEKIIVVGTEFHYQDLYHTLQRNPVFRFYRYDCFVEKDGKLDSLWPNHRSLEWLQMERATIGPLSFNRRFRNICLAEEEMAFRKDDIDACKDPTRRIGDVRPEWRKICAVDPASGKSSKYAAYPTFVLVGFDPKDEKRKRYLIDVFRKQSMGPHDMWDQLLFWHDRYAYEVLVVEVNAFGTWLTDENEPKVQELRRRGVRLVPHQTYGNKRDPEMGVRSMTAQLQDRLWSFPAATDTDEGQLTDFYDAFELYPQGFADYCMATWFAELQVRAGALTLHAVKPGGGRFYTQVRNPLYARESAAHENDTDVEKQPKVGEDRRQ